MKKTFYLSALITILVTGVVIGARYTDSFTIPANPGELRLGATIPLTGIAATYGEAIREGIELAREDLEKEGTRTKVFYEDVNIPGPLAVSAIRHLAEEKAIEALVGNFFNTNMPVMAPTITKEKIVSFHTAEADDLILDAGDYIFSTNAKIRDESEKMAQLAVERFKAKTAALLYVGTNWGESYNVHFTRAFKDLGGEVIYSELLALEERDIRTPMLKAAAAKPDILVAAYFGPILGVVLKTAVDLNVQQPIITVYEAEDPSVLETAGNVPDRQVYFFLPEPEPGTAAAVRFRRAFATRYGHAPNVFGANAYDATILAARALMACRRERACSRQFVAETRAYDGVSGNFSIAPDGGATKAFVLKTIVGGKFVPAR